MDPIYLTQEQYYLVLLANTVIGFLIGLVPLAFGFIKGQKKYAFFGLIACVVGGAIFSLLLSVPLAAIFVWLIFRGANRRPSDIAAETDVDNSAS